MTFAAILALFRRVPAWVWIAFLLLAAGWYYGHVRYNAGQADVQTKWDESVARGKAEVERLTKEAGKVTFRVETKYVDRVKTIREKGETIVQKVPVYISRDLPELPGAFRVLIDAAAEGTVPDAASLANGAPVAPQDVAASVGGNYTTCRENAERLIGLQEWVNEQKRLNP